jgi:hypothetical protein
MKEFSKLGEGDRAGQYSRWWGYTVSRSAYDHIQCDAYTKALDPSIRKLRCYAVMLGSSTLRP